MSDEVLRQAIQAIPAGAWAVGVSGGADSVALLALLRTRTDLSLHVVHLDHQTRGAESTGDAVHVAQLAQRWKLPCTVALREQIEPTLAHPPANLSARYRAVRLELFRKVVREHQLNGVILAHHADDQAETVLHRLLRGSGYTGLAGMSARATIGDLHIHRPLLSIRRELLRSFLHDEKITWREDASNQSPKYARNRIRQELAQQPALVDALLDFSRACTGLRNWSRKAAPSLTETFRMSELADLPSILAHESARTWLIARGVPVEQILPTTIENLIEMATDAASSPRADFPGNVRVSRKRGVIGTSAK